jgi:hypothetical protein
MEKNNNPYSAPNSLRLAFASDFASMGAIHNRWFGNLKNGKTWISVPEVPGSLVPSCVSDGKKPPLYTVNIKFRVSYDSEENRREIESWVTSGVVATYISASGKAMVAGSKMHPLTFSFSNVEGFDGYECTLIGTQTTPETFMQ